MTAKDGSVTYQWINAHPRATRRPSDYYYSCDMFQAMRPEFSDAPTLQPISLKTGEFKQIFVTVHTAKDQPAGLYKGTISVDSAKDGKKLAAIPVEIRVLPFELPAPCSFKNPEKKMLVMFYNYTYFHKIKELNGGDQKLAEKQMYETLRDQV